MHLADPHQRLDALLAEIDLPARAYELAEQRYEDLAAWMNRPASTLAAFDAHIFVQGSFAFGTAIRPVNEGDEYDLDFTCKLRNEISRKTHTQAGLKDLVGQELAAYRTARHIEKPLEPKTRCWRLGYKDELPFHMDVVPGLRADDSRRTELRERMLGGGIDPDLAAEAARRALWITDSTHENFERLSLDWPSSNPGGYQLWFTSRTRSASDRVRMLEAQVDPVPVFRSKTPLQQVVQLLKRHRDVMFRTHANRKPVSIILTTVAGKATVAGEPLEQTMRRVLDALEEIRRSDTNDIKNPVNPLENFADRWVRQDCVHLHLKQNFHQWIREARRHFLEIIDVSSPQRLIELAQDSLDVVLAPHVARQLVPATALAATPQVRVVAAQPSPPRPWAEA